MKNINRQLRYQLTAPIITTRNLQSTEGPVVVFEDCEFYGSGMAFEGMDVVVLENCKFGYVDTAVDMKDCGAAYISNSKARTSKMISAKNVGGIFSMNNEHIEPSEI
jgi:hypothetical protein